MRPLRSPGVIRRHYTMIILSLRSVCIRIHYFILLYALSINHDFDLVLGQNVTVTDQIYIFDLKSFLWVEDYIYPHPVSSPKNIQSSLSRKSRPNWIIGLTFAVLLGSLFLAFT